MVEIRLWVERFLKAIDSVFGDRVWFVGLQGSYGRGEAKPGSDIDLVVILDKVSPADIRAYREMLAALPDHCLACGFLSGEEELLRWDASDLFQLCHDTTPLRGSLDEALRRVTPDDVDRAIRLGACNLYHGCVHNLIYNRSEDVLRGLYKAAVFTVQAVCFRQTGTFVRRQADLGRLCGGEERAVVDTALRLRDGEPVDLDGMSELLFTWAKNRIQKINVE